MVFAKKLRDGVRSGEITTSIRIWKSPHVKTGGAYKMDAGKIFVTSIHEISFDDITEVMARESGFINRLDLVKTARHGSGSRVYFIRFYYEDLPAD